MKKKRSSLAMTKEQLAIYEAHTKGFLDRLFSGEVERELIAKGILKEKQPREPNAKRRRGKTRPKKRDK